MRNHLSDGDYSRVFSCIEAIYRCLSLEEFPHNTLTALSGLVETHLCGYNEVNLPRGRILAIVQPSLPHFAPLVGKFEKLMHEQPVITYFDRTGDGQALKISDFLGTREYHRRAIYRDVYRHMDVEDQMAIGVKLEPGFMVGIAMARRKRSFTEKDRQRLNLVRPHLARAYLRVAELAGQHDRTKDLTAALCEQGLGVMVLDKEGAVSHASPDAFACLGLYFKLAEPHPLVLPDELAQWAGQSQTAADPPPFVVHRDTAKLIVRKVHSDDRVVLLLSEQKEENGAARLERYELTPREQEVLKWLAEGKSNTAIGALLGLAPGTVKLHVGRILAKLGVENRTAAALLARGAL